MLETLGIPREDQPSFPYAPSTTPREEVLARTFRRDKSEVFQRHVGPVDANVVEKIEADATETGGTVLDEDYLVDQTPSQYHRNPSPPHSFYLDPGVSPSSAPPSPVTRGDLEECF
ncbi:hypothetical protein F0562_002959 [Nyssa sinensis]|uniref:Uncharacterized protein n=1 Tax=Nyssa sinensis TaxID=561372 RepID=A0A5J5BXF0_9ASTE|nr:hypothetical protein F0562_002959 [Nyssa sinensis]